jgi:glucose dehydrogenase
MTAPIRSSACRTRTGLFGVGEEANVEGLPLTSPPYAVLTAIDLNKGKSPGRCRWRRDAAIRNHPLLKGVTLPDRLGSPNNRGGALVTGSGLVFIGGGDKYLYAFDTQTGKEIWRIAIPYANTSNPMTYRNAFRPPVPCRGDGDGDGARTRRVRVRRSLAGATT